jgi:hypothetical protein
MLPQQLYNGTFTKTTLPKIGYIVITPPMAGTINATASPNKLTISLPQSTRWTNQSMPASLNFGVGGFDMRTAGANMTKGILGVPGLKVNIETIGLGAQSTTYDQTGEKCVVPSSQRSCEISLTFFHEVTSTSSTSAIQSPRSGQQSPLSRSLWPMHNHNYHDGAIVYHNVDVLKLQIHFIDLM